MFLYKTDNKGIMKKVKIKKSSQKQKGIQKKKKKKNERERERETVVGILHNLFYIHVNMLKL